MLNRAILVCLLLGLALCDRTVTINCRNNTNQNLSYPVNYYFLCTWSCSNC